MITRGQWGARPPKTVLPFWRNGQPSSKTGHYSDHVIIRLDGNQEYYAQIIRNIQRYHMDVSPEKYSDIAYNFLVSPTGLIFEGRGWDHPSAAQFGNVGNPWSLAVCYLGGVGTPFTPAAELSFHTLGAQVPGPWHGHKYWGATGCPGDSVMAGLARLNAGGTPAPAPTPAPPTENEADMVILSATNGVFILIGAASARNIPKETAYVLAVGGVKVVGDQAPLAALHVAATVLDPDQLKRYVATGKS